MSAADHLAGPADPGAEDLGAEVQLLAAERVVFFSDAVVAIAITLLALDLAVPGARASNAAVWHEVQKNLFNYLAFLISFVVIASHWRSHHRLFADVTRLSSPVITLNFLWLLTIVVTPFATRWLTVGGAFFPRFAFYAVVQIVLVLAFLVMSREIRANTQLRGRPDAPAPDVSDVGMVTAAVMFALSIPVSYVADDWAFAFWVASPYVTRLIRRIRNGQGGQSASAFWVASPYVTRLIRRIRNGRS
jgi:uncharacterized membrane protein